VTRYRLFLYAFPKAWRAQFAGEVLRLLDELDRGDARRFPCIELLHSGLGERVHDLRGRFRSPPTVGTSIVALRDAARCAAERRRRRQRVIAMVASPLLAVALGVPFALHLERPSAPSASPARSSFQLLVMGPMGHARFLLVYRCAKTGGGASTPRATVLAAPAHQRMQVTVEFRHATMCCSDAVLGPTGAPRGTTRSIEPMTFTPSLGA
jgi:hypothetical protein